MNLDLFEALRENAALRRQLADGQAEIQRLQTIALHSSKLLIYGLENDNGSRVAPAPLNVTQPNPPGLPNVRPGAPATAFVPVPPPAQAPTCSLALGPDPGPAQQFHGGLPQDHGRNESGDSASTAQRAYEQDTAASMALALQTRNEYISSGTYYGVVDGSKRPPVRHRGSRVGGRVERHPSSQHVRVSSEDYDDDSDSDDNAPILFGNPNEPQFVPHDRAASHCRTVIMTHIPKDVTMQDICSKVRGGPIFSIKLLDTAALIKHQTALIIFLESIGARQFVKYANDTQLMLNGKQPLVYILDSPTTPTPPRIHRSIIDFGATRCLILYSYPTHLTLHHLSDKLNPEEHVGMGVIINIMEDGEGLVRMEFASIDQAARARARINTWRAFAPTVAEFGPDPCSSRSGPGPAMRRTIIKNAPIMPRAMRARPARFRNPSYTDRDAPQPYRAGMDIDYGDDPVKEKAPVSSNLVDYSDLAPAVSAAGDMVERAGDEMKTAKANGTCASVLSLESGSEEGEILETKYPALVAEPVDEKQRIVRAMEKLNLGEMAKTKGPAFSGTDADIGIVNKHIGAPSSGEEAIDAKDEE